MNELEQAKALRLKHLPGTHDQSTHAGGKGGGEITLSNRTVRDKKTSGAIVSYIDANSTTSLNIQNIRNKVGKSAKFGIYGKTSVPIKKLKVDDFKKVMAETVGRQKSNKPIVIDSNGYVIDGRHRVAAAIQRGESTIEAYAPITEKQLAEAKALREKAKFSLQSVMIEADPAISERASLFQRIFDPADLTGDGLETDHHITVFYGLTAGVTAEQVAEAVNGRLRAFEVKFSGVSLFENPEFDVVKVDVDSPQLNELNAQIAKLPNENTRTVYQPHLTLAYVKPGMGRKYLMNPLEGKTMSVNTLVFSDTEGQKTAVPLNPPAALEQAKALRSPQTAVAPSKVYEALRARGYDMAQAASLAAALTAHNTTEKDSGAPIGLTVYKQADGRYRWVTRSSNAFRDRDGEIVSTKALADDVEMADQTKEYGPLRFWHMPGVDIGDCDFNWLRGRTLIESGTFRDPGVAQKVAQKADQFQVSLGFRHPHDEPDKYGVFHSIRRFERSLVPAGRAANPFTSLTVSKETGMNDSTKHAALKALLDGDEAQLKAVLAGAESTEKTAETLGIAFKEKSLDTMTPDELLDYAIARKEAELAVVEKAGEGEEEEEAPEMDDYSTKMSGLVTKMSDCVGRMEKMLGNREKDDSVTAVTEATNAHSARIAKLEALLATKTKELAEVTAAVSELKAEIPAGLGEGVRPTERTDNIVDAVAEKQVGGNGTAPLDTFLNGFVLGGMN